MELTEVVEKFSTKSKAAQLPENWSKGMPHNEVEAIIIANYPEIDMSFLEIAGQQEFSGLKFPQFACYRLTESVNNLCEFGVCSIEFNQYYGFQYALKGGQEDYHWGEAIETMPLTGSHKKMLIRQLLEMAKMSNGRCFTDKYHVFTDKFFENLKGSCFVSRFIGILPNEIKEKIQTESPAFENVYLVANAKWQKEEIIQNADPLLIGRIRKSFYLIDAFDTTSAEEYIRKEFTH